MLARPRRIAVASALVSGLVLALVPASPASAVTIPDWPASRVPTGCPALTPAEVGGALQLGYTDGVAPTVTGWTYNNATRRVVLKPGNNPLILRISVRQTCGGSEGVLAYGRSSIGGGAPSGLIAVPTVAASTNAFTSVWSSTGNVIPPFSGWVEIPVMVTAPRYSAFVLDDQFGLVSKTAYAGASTWVTGSWSTQRVYFILATNHTTNASKTSVRRGTAVTFATTFKAANGSTYAAKSGAVVKLQTKLPGGSWVTRATRTTSASGKATYTFAPSATMSWRWVAGENIATAPYTAASTSAVKTITVT
jgi:hypothetical protein